MGILGLAFIIGSVGVFIYSTVSRPHDVKFQKSLENAVAELQENFDKRVKEALSNFRREGFDAVKQAFDPIGLATARTEDRAEKALKMSQDADSTFRRLQVEVAQNNEELRRVRSEDAELRRSVLKAMSTMSSGVDAANHARDEFRTVEARFNFELNALKTKLADSQVENRKLHQRIDRLQQEIKEIRVFKQMTADPSPPVGKQPGISSTKSGV